MNYEYLENRINNYKLSGNSISAQILDIYLKKVKSDNDFVNLMYEFIDKAHVLEVDSDFIYQLKPSIKVNKASLNQYVLVSDVCEYLKNNNIHDYSIDELRGYVNKYEDDNNTNCSNICLALDLYEMLEKMENIIDDKINYEISNLSNIIDVADIKNSTNDVYFELFNTYQDSFKKKYLDNKIIDNEIYECFVDILNDLFAYQIHGYPDLVLNEQ